MRVTKQNLVKFLEKFIENKVRQGMRDVSECEYLANLVFTMGFCFLTDEPLMRLSLKTTIFQCSIMNNVNVRFGIRQRKKARSK